MALFNQFHLFQASLVSYSGPLTEEHQTQSITSALPTDSLDGRFMLLTDVISKLDYLFIYLFNLKGMIERIKQRKQR